jgi:hypothetical protein
MIQVFFKTRDVVLVRFSSVGCIHAGTLDG